MFYSHRLATSVTWLQEYTGYLRYLVTGVYYDIRYSRRLPEVAFSYYWLPLIAWYSTLGNNYIGYLLR